MMFCNDAKEDDGQCLQQNDAKSVTSQLCRKSRFRELSQWAVIFGGLSVVGQDCGTQKLRRRLDLVLWVCCPGPDS